MKVDQKLQAKIHRAGILEENDFMVYRIGNYVIVERKTPSHYKYFALDTKTMKLTYLTFFQYQLQQNQMHVLINRIDELFKASANQDLGPMKRDQSSQVKFVNSKEKYVSKKEKAQKLLRKIFEEVLPNNGLRFRKEQMELSLKMLTALQNNKIALCEAEVGTGKTHAYILASIVNNLYSETKSSSIIATSTIALQKAIVNEYLPQISAVLLKEKIISKSLSYVVRKGKSHYICPQRLFSYATSIREDNSLIVSDLFELMDEERQVDLDELLFSDFVKSKINVNGCPKDCGFKSRCRYKRFKSEANLSGYDFQIANHNYLIADVLLRKEGSSLMPEFKNIIIDEAHKFSSAIRDMYTKTISEDDIPKLITKFCREFKVSEQIFNNLTLANKEMFIELKNRNETLITLDDTLSINIKRIIRYLERMKVITLKYKKKLNKVNLGVSEIGTLLSAFEILRDDKEMIKWLVEEDKKQVLSFLSSKHKRQIEKDLWKLNIPTIMTSGTISIDSDFSYIKHNLGLDRLEKRIITTNNNSPYNFKKQAILHLPSNMPTPDQDSEKYINRVTDKITELIKVTHGHTLILFTSYKLLDTVHYKISQKGLNYPLIKMGKGNLNAIDEFKNSKNGVLFASDAAGEGIDIAGDVLSSLIVVRLPFPIPNAVSEYEKNQKENFDEFLDEEVVPNMIIKLRQWIGRGIRRETDTCAFTILDSRASGRYKETILNALPQMPVTTSRTDVSQFILDNKTVDYFD